MPPSCRRLDPSRGYLRGSEGTEFTVVPLWLTGQAAGRLCLAIGCPAPDIVMSGKDIGSHSMSGKERHTSVPVDVGGVTVGGGAPIVVQSMTNTDTADVEATARQVVALAQAGSEL